jgi:cell filamentation protein
MYDAVEDPYCYPGTTVLVNKLELLDQSSLDAFEAEITRQRSAEPLPAGDLDGTHYLAIHRHLFQDVYTWAGEFRSVRIAKDGSMFCYPEHIQNEMTKLFDGLRKADYLRNLDRHAFTTRAADFVAELNAIHPFREGNGRTQLAFLTLLADIAGHPLALERLNSEEFLSAMIDSFKGDNVSLTRSINQLVGN